MTTSSNISKIWKRFQHGADLVITASVILTFAYLVLLVLPHLEVDAHVFPNLPQLNTSILWIHVICAFPPLLIGPITFNKSSRFNNPAMHRWLGTIYCLGIWISALSGILLASTNRAGIGAQLGFGILGVLWFCTTLLAYKTAREKNFVAHRRWMIRSYSLTLAVVSIRGMFWFPPSQIDQLTWLVIVSWLCWVPNVIFGEIYIRLTTPNGKLLNS